MENANFVKQNLLFVLISFVMMIFSCSSVKGYKSHCVIDPQDYLTFTAGDEPVIVTLNPGFVGSNGDDAEIQYTFGNSAINASDYRWTTFEPGKTVIIPAKTSIKLRGKSISTSGMSKSLFTFSNTVSASGYVDSLRLEGPDYKRFLGLDESCYCNMFNGCEHLLTPPELGCEDMTIFVNGKYFPTKACYFQMFKNCKDLKAAPDLPAKILADSCYGNMFNGCTNLIYHPNIGAEKLAENCYSNMFGKCTSMRLSVDGIGNGLEPYPFTWKIKVQDSGDSKNSYMDMFDVKSFPSYNEFDIIPEIYEGRPNLSAIVDNYGYVKLYSMYPSASKNNDDISPIGSVVDYEENITNLDDSTNSESCVDLQDTIDEYVKSYSKYPLASNSRTLQNETDVTSQEINENSKSNNDSKSNINFNDTLIGYVNITLGDSGGNYIVDDPISINDKGTINEVELKWDDGNGNTSSLDSMDGSTKAYITVWKKQDNSYVASSRWFYLISENGKTMIPSQKMYKGFEGQAASDNVSDANVWNDKTPAVYNLSITVDAA